MSLAAWTDWIRLDFDRSPASIARERRELIAERQRRVPQSPIDRRCGRPSQAPDQRPLEEAAQGIPGGDGMMEIPAQHVPAYINRGRLPGEFWWIAPGGSITGMSAACPCGCGAELRVYGLSGSPSYPSFREVIQCSAGSQWMLRDGMWLSAGRAKQALEPMF